MPAQTIQRLLLFLFVAFAALTAFQQLRYGMICGRTEQADKQEDPKARACRQRAVVYAVCAAACSSPPPNHPPEASSSIPASSERKAILNSFIIIRGSYFFNAFSMLRNNSS